MPVILPIVKVVVSATLIVYPSRWKVNFEHNRIKRERERERDKASILSDSAIKTMGRSSVLSGIRKVCSLIEIRKRDQTKE